jgi:predicted glycosyltransferase
MKGPKYIIGSKEIIPTLPVHLSEYFKPNNNWKETDELLLKTKVIMSYCGYSTIMDVEFLQCEAKLIPTKGQLEQMYLAEKLTANKKALINDQGFSK